VAVVDKVVDTRGTRLTAQKTHFTDGGTFDQIYRKK